MIYLLQTLNGLLSGHLIFISFHAKCLVFISSHVVKYVLFITHVCSTCFMMTEGFRTMKLLIKQPLNQPDLAAFGHYEFPVGGRKMCLITSRQLQECKDLTDFCRLA